jgi:hypothetical protein
MKFNSNNTEIIIVNYNTPDFIIRLHSEIREFIGDDITIHIVDGSDGRLQKRGINIINLNEELKIILEKDINSNHHILGYNIHHGPGMHWAISEKVSKEYVLILDSDVSILKDGLLNLFSDNYEIDKYCYGLMCKVNESGFDVPDGSPYIHPSTMLLNVNFYLDFKFNFIKHGAPCIDFMRNIDSNKLKGISNLDDYRFISGRGTVNLFGYNL